MLAYARHCLAWRGLEWAGLGCSAAAAASSLLASDCHQHHSPPPPLLAAAMAATAAPATTVGTPPAPTTTARATRAAGRTARPASEYESARCWPACCQVAMHQHAASARMPGQPAYLPDAGSGGAPVGCRCRCNIWPLTSCGALPCHVVSMCCSFVRSEATIARMTGGPLAATRQAR